MKENGFVRIYALLGVDASWLDRSKPVTAASPHPGVPVCNAPPPESSSFHRQENARSPR
ncbi:hypothetical protein PAXRUDRAFT_832220 [Paxillus rubicundulus Ve08.2h10]|uniref:Uncharacterized protein n=1 Tax=Paxillus rubicundulus Ve08.2h10 TaxID=930991 RepID=A0A0D0CIC9_9AGAM|nr:hypothetical protein PAXRUDRAFT_832220 [Paxillus rubicundulus Ve08.2h10]